MNGEAIGLAALQGIVLAIMLFGLLGLIIPVLPGLVIIWVPALVYGILTGFNWVSGGLFAVMTVLMLIGNELDTFFMGARARQSGASWLTIGAALVAGLLGSLAFPPFGGLIAALLAMFGLEYYRLKNANQALESTKNMAIGCGWGAVARFFVGSIMILLWVLWINWA